MSHSKGLKSGKVQDLSSIGMSTIRSYTSETPDPDAISRNFQGSFIFKRHEITIHECVRNGDVQMLVELLSSPDTFRQVNEPDDSSQTPLHYAAKANNLRACQLLLDTGKAKPTSKDDDGATPLHYACRRKLLEPNQESKDVVQLLAERSNLQAGMVTDDYGSSPIHTAAMRGNVVAIQAILDYCDTLVDAKGEKLMNKKDLVNQKDKHGCTPLHESATYSHVRVAGLLIKHGSKIRATDFDRCTPLHLACVDGSLSMVKLLLNKCEPEFLEQLIEAKDKDDTTALQYAVEARNLEIIKDLIKGGAEVNNQCRLKTGGSTALHLAAIAGERAIAEYLVDAGADVTQTDNRNCTPLHSAAQYNSKAVVDIILRQPGVDINQRDVDGWTPLMVATVYGGEDILELFLRRKADVAISDKTESNVLHLAAKNDEDESMMILLNHIRNGENKWLVNDVDRNGQTSLHIAAQRGNVNMVKLLLDAGSDLFAKDETEETPFLQAAELGKVEVVRELIIYNEKVINDEDEFSNTGLHKAAENGHLEVVKVMVNLGATKEARNTKYWTPLDVAASKGHDEIVHFLLDENVSPNPMDKNMTTPLHLAARYGHSDTVRCLIEGGADVGCVDINGKNCLDIAITCGHRHVALVILNSKAWYIALSNETTKEYSKHRNTPLRDLFIKMPDVARAALTQCMTRGRDFIEFNYDYLDDSYTDYKRLGKESKVPQLKDQTLPSKDQQYYTRDKNWIKKNHPLTRLVHIDREECEELINHPVVLGLIRHKWKAIRVFYYLFLVFYALFVSMITAYMVMSTPPNRLLDPPPDHGTETLRSWCYRLQTDAKCETCDAFFFRVSVVIWIMSGIGVIIELIQVISQGWLYFKPLNILDWYTYISAVVISFDFKVDNCEKSCSIKRCWQWQMGAFTVFVSWFVILLFIRRLPGLGIYVVMIVEIMKTFLKFFIVFFLFVIAFALSFHILLQDQAPFTTPFYAISKTWVMMLGEMDYDSIFHSDENLPYQNTTYGIFWLFLILMAIIVMNLLTGLAVDDVTLLRKTAKVVKLKLQIDLALDIELAMPKRWRRTAMTVVRRDRIYLKRESGRFWQMLENIQVAIEGAMLTRTAVIDAGNNMPEDTDNDLPELIRMESRINKQLHTSRQEVQNVYKKLEQLEQLLLLQAQARELDRPERMDTQHSRGGHGADRGGGGGGGFGGTGGGPGPRRAPSRSGEPDPLHPVEDTESTLRRSKKQKKKDRGDRQKGDDPERRSSKRDTLKSGTSLGGVGSSGTESRRVTTDPTQPSTESFPDPNQGTSSEKQGGSTLGTPAFEKRTTYDDDGPSLKIQKGTKKRPESDKIRLIGSEDEDESIA